MWTNARWDVIGYGQNPVPNDFYQKAYDNSRLAVLLPGFGYSADAPLLYYASGLLFELGFDVLALNYRYNGNKSFLGGIDSEKAAWLRQDVLATSSIALSKPQYKEWVLIGKSLGTEGILRILQSGGYPSKTKLVWLTPGQLLSEIADKAIALELPSLFVVGTDDRYYDAAEYDKLRKNDRIQVLVIEGADHGLELPNDLNATINILKGFMQTLRSFALMS